MYSKIDISRREVDSIDIFLLEKEIRNRMAYQAGNDVGNRLKSILDNRPRYSKRIPIKLYMKFHTLEVIRWEAKTYKKPWMWYTLEQENEVRLKFRFF